MLKLGILGRIRNALSGMAWDRVWIAFPFVLLALSLILVGLSYSVVEGLSGLFWGRLLVGLVYFVVAVIVLMGLRELYGEVVDLRKRLSRSEVEVDRLRRELLGESEHEATALAETAAVNQRLQSLDDRLAGRSREILTRSFFTILSEEWQLVQCLVYRYDNESERYECGSGYRYAYFSNGGQDLSFGLGETLTGQVTLECKPLILRDLPSDYRVITSGLGHRVPSLFCIFPLGRRTYRSGLDGLEDQEFECASGALECAFFRDHGDGEVKVLERFCERYWNRLESLPVS